MRGSLRLELDDIIATLDEDPARFAVCADMLVAAGEPQGQLMALQLRGLNDGPLQFDLKELVHKVAGSSRKALKFGWRWGFVDSLVWPGLNGFHSFEGPYSELTRLMRTKAELVPAMPWHREITAADRLRVYRLLSRVRTLHVSPWEMRQRYDQLWSLIAREGLPPSVKELVLSDVPDKRINDHQITWIELGDLSQANEPLRQLERISLRGSFLRLGEVDLPRLKELSIFSSTFSDVGPLRSARWPSLEKLSVGFGDDTYNPEPATLEDLKALLREVPEKVRHLGLRNLPFTDELIAPLATSAVLKRLMQLDLSFGVLLERGSQLLEQHAAAFAHLELLDVTDTGLTHFDELKLRIPGLHRGPEWRTKVDRYVSVSE